MTQTDQIQPAQNNIFTICSQHMKTRSQGNEGLLDPNKLLFKYGKRAKQTQKRRDHVVLFSSHKAKKFAIFLDEEIGMTSLYQNELIQMDMDEDFESSDDVIQYGVNKCMKILKAQRSKETQGDEMLQSESDNDCSLQTQPDRSQKEELIQNTLMQPQKHEQFTQDCTKMKIN